jgi:hypothetical protein
VIETPERSGAGYPEEAPAPVADDEGTPQEGRGRESGGGDRGRADEPDSEPGKATGNPDAAGGE